MEAPGVQTLLVTVPGDPIPKGRAKVAPGKFPRLYTPKRTVEYENRVGQFARKALTLNAPWSGPVSITMLAFFGIPKSRPKYFKREALSGHHSCDVTADLDNLIKSALDGMNGIVYDDDRQVVRFRGCEKRWTETDNGRLLIKVTFLPNDYLVRNL